MRFYEGMGVPKQFDKAFANFLQSAEAGNGRAMAKVGWMYWFGEGVDSDAKQGARWFQKGAQLGNAESQFWLSTFYDKGYGNLKKDRDRSIFWLRKAAAQGYPKAVSTLQALESAQQ